MFHPTDSVGERQCLRRQTAYNADLIKRKSKDIVITLKMLLNYIVSIQRILRTVNILVQTIRIILWPYVLFFMGVRKRCET